MQFPYENPSPSRNRGEAAAVERPTVLCVGYTPYTLTERCELLRVNGYAPQPANNREEALGYLRERPFSAVVVGHAVPERERNEFIQAARTLNPDAIVVLLYWDSIRRTEAADAILCIGNGPMALVQALRDLLGQQPD